MKREIATLFANDAADGAAKSQARPERKVEVVLEGAGSGESKGPPKPSGAIHFSRSLPLASAGQ